MYSSLAWGPSKCKDFPSEDESVHGEPARWNKVLDSRHVLAQRRQWPANRGAAKGNVFLSSEPGRSLLLPSRPMDCRCETGQKSSMLLKTWRSEATGLWSNSCWHAAVFSIAHSAVNRTTPSAAASPLDSRSNCLAAHVMTSSAWLSVPMPENALDVDTDRADRQPKICGNARTPLRINL
eukprot:15478109-Alexandrium_andersonii.AAC.2